MSRCFPYPPPGYRRDGAIVETLFEPMKKLQEERDAAIAEYFKEKSVEKKERSKGKNENKVDKFHQGKKSFLPKEREEEAEKSGLAEEHEQPVSSQTNCYLSDGTQSNKKRKRDDLASNDGKSGGAFIRIGLPLRKDREPDVSLSREQLCYTSGRAHSFCQQNEIMCMPNQEQFSFINSKMGTKVGETLFESMKKLQKERDAALVEYFKEKSGEKKERSKGKTKNKVDKFHQGKKGFLPKEREEEAEKSGLTEEHGQPLSAQTICYLSDGTQSNRKRKRDDLASNDGKSVGTVIRRRLPLLDREPDVSLSREQLCSASGRGDSLCPQNEIIRIPGQEHCSSVNSKMGVKVGEPTSTPEKAPCSLDSETKENFGCRYAETFCKISIYEKKMKATKSQYKALIEDWVPPTIQFEQNDCDDQEWLFEAKKQGRDRNRRFEASHDVSCLESSTSWPCAHYIPEADVYALPYTVPF